MATKFKFRYLVVKYSPGLPQAINQVASATEIIFKVAVWKTLVMGFSFIEAGDWTLQLKNSIRDFSNEFWYKLMRFYQYSESNYSTFPITIDSYPTEAIIIWLTKQMNTLSNQSFRGFFVKFFGQEKLEVFYENLSGGAMF